MKSPHPSLLAQLDNVLGSRYFGFVAGLALALAGLLALAAWAQGADWEDVRAALWRLGLNPAITIYILLVHPFMHRRWQRAMDSLHALAPDIDAASSDSAASRREWGALLLGALIGFALAYRTPAAEGWLRVYALATSALTFALLGTAIYGSLARSRHLATHSRAGLELSVFDGHLLTPFAQWGQSLSLVFVGGISLSLLFQSSHSLRSIEGVVIYGSLTVIALTLFFMSMWTIHVALAKAQQHELARVRSDLAAAREALQRERSAGTAGTMPDAYVPAVICGIYEQQVLDASTWPFDPAIFGRVLASAVAPLTVYVLKIAFGVGSGL